MSRYGSIDFTTDFMESFARKDLSVKERRAILKALELLDKDERHPSLRLHALSGELSGQCPSPQAWSSGSRSTGEGKAERNWLVVAGITTDDSQEL